jgi:signal transduction histidine kinase
MRERAELLGGTIEFLEPPGGGTLVRLRVPVGTGAAA